MKDLENAWEKIEENRRSKKKKLVDLKWQCGFCLKELPWVSFALDNEAQPAKSIEEYILKPGSARCCKKCLRGETRGDTQKDKGMALSYVCKVCSRSRPMKCFDKNKLSLYKEIDELRELVCFDCIDVSNFEGRPLYFKSL